MITAREIDKYMEQAGVDWHSAYFALLIREHNKNFKQTKLNADSLP